MTQYIGSLRCDLTKASAYDRLHPITMALRDSIACGEDKKAKKAKVKEAVKMCRKLIDEVGDCSSVSTYIYAYFVCVCVCSCVICDAL